MSGAKGKIVRKTVLITGCSEGGIGAALAIACECLPYFRVSISDNVVFLSDLDD